MKLDIVSITLQAKDGTLISLAAKTADVLPFERDPDFTVNKLIDSKVVGFFLAEEGSKWVHSWVEPKPERPHYY